MALCRQHCCIIEVLEVISCSGAGVRGPGETVLTVDLSETSDSINASVTKISGLVPFLMGLLNDASHSPAETKAGVVQCLSSLTDDNDEIIERLLEAPEYVSLLITLQGSESPLIRMSSCGMPPRPIIS